MHAFHDNNQPLIDWYRKNLPKEVEKEKLRLINEKYYIDKYLLLMK